MYSSPTRTAQHAQPSGTSHYLITHRAHTMPMHPNITHVTYHRPPTAWELKVGAGAIHYRDFTVAECCFPGTRIRKKWFVADDGLRYYR